MERKEQEELKGEHQNKEEKKDVRRMTSNINNLQIDDDDASSQLQFQ